MAGMVRGLMPLTVTRSISGAPVWVHTIPVSMRIKFTPDHRRSPMSGPLVPSWEFKLTRNPNPFSLRRRLMASMAKSPFEPGR